MTRCVDGRPGTEGTTSGPAGHAQTVDRKRPGTITAVQVLLGLGAGSQAISALTALTGLSMASSFASIAPELSGDAQTAGAMASAQAAAVLVLCWSLAMVAFDIWAIVAVGARRPVARILVTLMPLPAAIVNMINALLLDGGAAGALAAAAMVLPLGITLTILLWLPQSSRAYFDPGQASWRSQAPWAAPTIPPPATTVGVPSVPRARHSLAASVDVDPPTVPIALRQYSRGTPVVAAGASGRHPVVSSDDVPETAGRGRANRLPILVAGAALVLVIVGVTTIVTSGSGVGIQPCEAAARTSLVGFQGVRGPLPAQQEMTQYLGDDARFCRYTQGGALMARAGVVGSNLLLGRVPRAVVERSSRLSAEFHADVRSRMASSSSPVYPVELSESGVTALVHPSAVTRGVDTVIVNCATTDDYWNIQVASTGRDDSLALDALLSAMNCGPSTP